MKVFFFLLLLASIVPYFDAIAPSAAALAVAVIVAVVSQVTNMYMSVRVCLASGFTAAILSAATVDRGRDSQI